MSTKNENSKSKEKQLESKKKEKVTVSNGNVFAKSIMEKYDFLYSIDGSFYNYADGVYTPIPDMVMRQVLREEFQEAAPSMWKPNCERFYMEALKLETFYSGQMNSNKYYINLLNGMLDLDTLKLKKHSMEYYSTVQLPFSYNSKAKCPLFQQYLADVFEGDQERIDLAQEWIGYLLTFETKAQKALILYGSGGNGKGVFSTVIEGLIGKENISYIGLSDLSNQFVRATLFGKQLMLSSENEIGRLNTQYFKQIVGGDTYIMASHKGKKPFEFLATCKIVMSTNNLPDTRDRSEGYYRRLSLLHFSKYFSEEEKDVNLADKLTKELPGILNWALTGLQKLRDNNYRFSSCASSDTLLREYRTEQNPFLEFADECLVFGDEQAKEINRVVYNSFRHWCYRNGHRNCANISSKKFWRELDNASILLGQEPPKRKNSGNIRFCVGITVKKEYRYTSCQIENGEELHEDDLEIEEDF